MFRNKVTLANAFAITTTASWIICSLFVAVFPKLSYFITLWWFHGLFASPMGDMKVTLSSVIFGGFFLAAFAWIAGYVFGMSMDMLQKKR